MSASLPYEDSITRLVGAVLLEQDDERTIQRRHMQIEGMSDLDAPAAEQTLIPAARAA